MVRRSLRAGLWLGLLVGLAWSVRRVLLLRRVSEGVEVSRDPWTPLPQPHTEPTAQPPKDTVVPSAGEATLESAPAEAVAPSTPVKATTATKATRATKTAKAATAARARTWVATPDGVCPPGHPVKAKTSSRIFRVPGMSGYDETRPDRCYRTEDDAAADGFTRAKR